MKKRVLILALSVIICLSICLVCFVGCHMQRVNAGKMEEVVGTYKLVEFNRTPDGEENATNMIQAKGISAYIVVNSDGFGYYAYKDNETDLWYDTICIEFTKDTDDETLIKGIDYTVEPSRTKKGDCSQDFPGRGTENLGFTVDNHSLNYTITNTKNKFVNIDYKAYIRYERISKDTTKATVEKELGVTFKQLPDYVMQNITGVFYYQTNLKENPYIYDVLEIEDNISFTGKRYYSAKADGVEKVEDVSLQVVKKDENFYYIKVSGQDIEYKVLISKTPATSFEYNEWNGNELVYSEAYYKDYTYDSVQGYIDNAKALYNP